MNIYKAKIVIAVILLTPTFLIAQDICEEIVNPKETLVACCFENMTGFKQGYEFANSLQYRTGIATWMDLECPYYISNDKKRGINTLCINLSSNQEVIISIKQGLSGIEMSIVNVSNATPEMICSNLYNFARVVVENDIFYESPQIVGILNQRGKEPVFLKIKLNRFFGFESVKLNGGVITL